MEKSNLKIVSTSFKFSTAYSKESWQESSSMSFDTTVTPVNVIRAFKLIMQAQNTIDALLIPMNQKTALEKHEIGDYLKTIKALSNNALNLFKEERDREDISLDVVDKANFLAMVNTLRESIVIFEEIFNDY